MSDDEKEFEKIFSEIINSNDLNNISETFAHKKKINVKELLLMQQSLLDAVSNISDILIEINMGESNSILDSEEEYYDVLTSLYKISEDFNECMIEYCSDIEIQIFEDEDEDEGDNNDGI
jgi:hypothetical protein